MAKEFFPAAFYFQVKFNGKKSAYTSFQEVSGIKATVKTESVASGGENYEMRLPKGMEYTTLKLKRGIASASSPLVKWCRAILTPNFANPITLKDISVSLMNPSHNPCRSWDFVNAYPISWELDAFNSTKNEVAIETIELTYHYFERTL